MKLVYLIMAHSQPNHLQRLVSSLNTDDVRFYIHLDRKSDINAFHPESYPTNAQFLSDRIRVVHGGFSLVDAMIKLMDAAVNGGDFDYCQFLSGWDYPIKSTQFIHEFLSQKYPMNFMNFYRLTETADFYENVTKYYFIDFIGNSPRIFQKPMKAIQYVIQKSPIDRPFFGEMTPYRGSCWFCLNKATIFYIMNFLNTDKGKRYYMFFKNVLCADEIFFQTIVMNSPFAEYCRYYDRDSKAISKNENKAYLHYIDWNQKRENPAVFDESDFISLVNSPALYARKFTETKSTKLIESLNRQMELMTVN